jgi:hypothetical protein
VIGAVEAMEIAETCIARLNGILLGRSTPHGAAWGGYFGRGAPERP